MLFKLLFIYFEVSNPNPFHFLSIFLGFCLLHPLVNKDLDTKADDVFVHDFTIPYIGYEFKESFPQLHFDRLEQEFIEVVKKDDT